MGRKRKVFAANNKSTPEYVMEHLVKIYQMARDGYSGEQMIAELGISHVLFHKWKRKYKCVRDAIEQGHAVEKQVNATKFRDYIFDHLPKKLRKLWALIMEEKDDEDGTLYDLVDKKLKDGGKLARQQLFLYALIHSDYNASTACKRVHIDKRVFDRWCEEDGFQELWKQVEWHKKNYFEEAVVDLVRQRNPAIVKLANQAYNADRGYGNRKVIDKNVTVNGHVTHNKVVTVKVKDMSLEARKELLRKLREGEGNNRSLKEHVPDAEVLSVKEKVSG